MSAFRGLIFFALVWSIFLVFQKEGLFFFDLPLKPVSVSTSSQETLLSLHGSSSALHSEHPSISDSENITVVVKDQDLKDSKESPQPKIETILPQTESALSPGIISTIEEERGINEVGLLNEKGIITLTNEERKGKSLHVLAWNAKLSKMAELKAQDMLDHGYFAHESPSGKNVAGLADEVGYAYKTVGENLAVGDFVSNHEVVTGWMNSPGHRENILKSDFSEIGVAAIPGFYEGNKVWMVVQEFGHPLPSCKRPDPYLKDRIDLYTEQIETLQATLHKSNQIIATTTDDQLRVQEVKDYNIVVKLYNTLIYDLRTFIDAYNTQVNTYNTCISG